jgi:CheY-like chemotaxis protein
MATVTCISNRPEDWEEEMMSREKDGKRVLVVDDEPRVLTSIEDLLEDEFEVLTTTDAQEALRLLEEQEVSVILSDQRMPGLSGDQFLSRAKEVSEAARVLITGYADLDAVTRAVNDAQIYACMAKPWDPAELKTVVQRAAEHYEAAHGPPLTMKARGRQAPVLMVDDDPEDALLVKEAWKVTRFVNELRTLENGEELMDYLRRRGAYSNPADSPRPGLILLDLNMPRKNGFEALQEIKADPGLRHIPVVVLTSSHDEPDVLRVYDLGASGFISKPVTFDAFAETMKVLVRYWFEIVELPRERKGGRSVRPPVKRPAR